MPQLGIKPVGAVRQRRRLMLLALVFVGGVTASEIIAHHGMIFSGLQRMQVEPVDTPFNNYLLEHSYQWLRLKPRHKVLWDPPFFYPITNVLAYSDIMVSFAPPYWIPRLLGLPPDTAFQWWMMGCTAGNFAVAWLFLRRCFHFTPVGTVFGAVLLAAANSRIFNLGHQQLFSQAYFILAILAAFEMFRPKKEVGRDRTPWWIVLLATSWALQFWGGFYIGFFMVLLGMIAAAWALILPSFRAPFLGFVRQYALVLLAAAAGMLLFLGPLMVQYLATYQNSRPIVDEIASLLPRWYSWLYMGAWNLAYGRAWKLPLVNQPLWPWWENVGGLGLVTTAVALAAAWKGRKRPDFLLVALVSFTLILVATSFGNFSLWWAIYHLVPGAKAIRAVARAGIVLLVPAAIGLAYIIDELHAQRLLWLGLLIGALSLAEQIQSDRSYDKIAWRNHIAAIARHVPPTTKILYYSTPARRWSVGEVQMEALWVALETHVLTINGHSGNLPPEWGELYIADRVNSPRREAVIRKVIQYWAQRQDLSLDAITWLNGDKLMDVHAVVDPKTVSEIPYTSESNPVAPSSTPIPPS